MRSLIIPSLALLLVAGLSSCSSAYRSGQTPDDVYYSPAREVASYATVDNDRRNGSRYNDRNSGYDDQYAYDDYWLRMRVRNRYRWSAFDDYGYNDYGYNSWNSWGTSYNSWGGYGYYSPFSFNNYWNNYYYWNSYYNPYCGGIIVVNPKTSPTVYNRVRNFSLAGYNNNTYSNSNRPSNLRTSRSGFNNSNGTYSNGNNNRRASSSGSRESYYSPSNDRPARSYQPSSSSSSSNGGYSPSSSSSSSSRSGGGGSSGGSSGGGGGSSPSRPSRGN